MAAQRLTVTSFGAMHPSRKALLLQNLSWRCTICWIGAVILLLKTMRMEFRPYMGLGVEDAFHTYLEATFHRAMSNPLAGAHTVAGLVYLHFTSMRYGSNWYQGDHGKPCKQCGDLLKDITARSGLHWEPTSPPGSYDASEKFRQLGKLVVDTFEKRELAQIGMSWLQYLIVSGEIWLFDALIKIDAVDSHADWA